MRGTPDVTLTVRVNGEEHELTDGTTIRGLLDVLELTSDRVAVERNGELVRRSHHARVALAEADEIEQCLRSLTRAGLGYIALGQPLSTLSSGEIQRLRLAQALAQGADRTLFVLDERRPGCTRPTSRY